jgi:hypothetical protein
MLNVCDEFAKAFDVRFNSKKSKLLIFGESAKNITVHFGDGYIEYVKCDKHLGNVIGPNTDTIMIDEGKNILYKRTNMILSHFKHVSHDIKYELFKTYCMPLYGSQLWNYGSRHIDSFYTAWRKCIRRLLGLPYNTHCNLLPHVCDDSPIHIQMLKRVVNFIKGISSSNNKITNLCYMLCLNGSGSNVSQSMSMIASLWNIRRERIVNMKISNPPYECDPNTLILCSVIRDLLEFQSFSNHNTFFSQHELRFMIDFLCTE